MTRDPAFDTADRFDEEALIARVKASRDGYAVISPALMRASWQLLPLRPDPSSAEPVSGFQPAALIVPLHQAVPGLVTGLVRGSRDKTGVWALIPRAAKPGVTVFDLRCGPPRGGFERVACFRDAAAAIRGAVVVHEAPAIFREMPHGREADALIIERMLIAAGLHPGRVPDVVDRVYAAHDARGPDKARIAAMAAVGRGDGA